MTQRETPPLRADQIQDLAFLFANPRALLLHEPGVGKTPTIVTKQYARTQQGMKTMWVMPKSLLKKNRDEILRFTPLDEADVVIVDGTPAKVTAALASSAKIFLIGPTRFELLKGKLPAGVRAIDVDEMHMCFKGCKSARTQAFLAAVRKMDETVMMSGTLIDGRLDSAWPAIHAIEPRYYPLGYAQFLGAHGILDDYDRPVAWRGHDRIGKILIKHGVRRTFESVYGKQEMVPFVELCEMHKAQRKVYDELASTAMVELEHAMIDGTSPGVNVIRCMQLMNHPERFPDPRGAVFMPLDLLNGDDNGKIEQLKIHLEDHLRSGEPLVIFAAWQPQQQLIFEAVQKAGLSVELLDANCSSKRRAQIDETFRAGKTQVIVASPKVAGVGFNWQYWGPKRVEVSHCIFASLTYLDSDFVQAYRRFIREKRRRALRVTILAYEDSLDQRMLKIHEIKSRDAHKVDPTREVLSFSR